MQLTLSLSPEIDAVGRTDIVPEACPGCHSNPAPLRHVSTRVLDCRFCRALLQRDDGGVLVLVYSRRAK